MDALLLEIRLSIGAIQFYLSVHEKSTVKIHKNKIEFTGENGVTKIYAFKNFTVQPNSCKGLKYVPTEGLHFRMSLGEEKLTEQQPKLSSNGDVEPRLLSDEVSFYCATCGYCVSRTMQ